MGDIDIDCGDCDSDFGDCDCDCDGDCCCCCCSDDCCDFGSGKMSSWDNFTCLICINVSNTRPNNNYYDDFCHRCCCWCCYDDYNKPRQQQRPTPQVKNQESHNSKQQEENHDFINGRRKENERYYWESRPDWMKQEMMESERRWPKEVADRRNENANGEWDRTQHAPTCPCYGTNIPKYIFPCTCNSRPSPSPSPSSFDPELEPPMVQRFQPLDREKYMIKRYELYGNDRHSHW